MNVILIAYAYPPYPIVGARRPFKIAGALAARGHHVDVITTAIPEVEITERAAASGVTLHEVGELPSPRSLYLKSKEILARFGGAKPSRGANPNSLSAREESTTPDGRSRLRRTIVSLIRTPDANQGFIPTSFKKALQLARSAKDEQTIFYTTAPPFSSHLAGLLLARVTGLPWVAEYRDPWYENPSRTPEMRSSLARRTNLWLEDRCLHSASGIVAASPSVADALRTRAGAAVEDRVRLVLNGIDFIERPQSATPVASPDDSAVFRFVHTGGLYHDARPFLRALAAAISAEGLSAARVAVEFVGGTPSVSNPTLEELSRELGLQKSVTFEPWLPIEMCREKMRSSDCLLLLCEDHPQQIPNKLYDYLGMNKPILAFVDPEGEAWQMLEAAGNHAVVTNEDSDSTIRAIRSLLRVTPQIENSPELIDEWSTPTQTGRLVAFLEGLAA